MRLGKRVCLPLVALGLTGAGPGAESSKTSIQESWTREFLQAYRTGTPEAFGPLCDAYDLPVGADPAKAKRFCMGYLYRLRLRYGPAKVISIENGELGPKYWLEGQSGAVWAIRFDPKSDQPHKIDGVTLTQGLLPAGYLLPPPLPPGQVPQALGRHFSDLADAGSFSGVVLVARNGQVIFQQAYGLSDEYARVPNDLDTYFRIASVGKMLTTLAILTLVDEGRLNLDDPVSEWIPDYPPDIAKKVTLRHLLTHTSGIELDDYAPFNADIARAGSLEDILAAHKRHIRNLNEGRYDAFRPLERFDYSNENFDILGMVLQKVADTDWTEAIAQRSIRPAGAEDIRFNRPESGFARNYSTMSPEGWDINLADRTDDLSDHARPAGSHFATVPQVFRFMRYLEVKRAGSATVKEATMQKVAVDEETPVKLGYGLGFEIERHSCFESYGHTGAQTGASSVARNYPGRDTTIVVVANRDGIAHDAASYIERALFGC